MLRTTFLTGLLAVAIGLAACSGGMSGGTTPTLSATTTGGSINIPPPAVQGVPTVTASGLQIYDIQIGTGVAATAGDSVTVNYTGWLPDGTTFISSSANGGPASFTLSQVIPGWTEGVSGMKIGGKRRLIVPPDLAFGAAGSGPVPANATLTFDIELVSIP